VLVAEAAHAAAEEVAVSSIVTVAVAGAVTAAVAAGMAALITATIIIRETEDAELLDAEWAMRWAGLRAGGRANTERRVAGLRLLAIGAVDAGEATQVVGTAELIAFTVAIVQAAHALAALGVAERSHGFGTAVALAVAVARTASPAGSRVEVAIGGGGGALFVSGAPRTAAIITAERLVLWAVRSITALGAALTIHTVRRWRATALGVGAEHAATALAIADRHAARTIGVGTALGAAIVDAGGGGNATVRGAEAGYAAAKLARAQWLTGRAVFVAAALDTEAIRTDGSVIRTGVGLVALQTTAALAVTQWCVLIAVCVLGTGQDAALRAGVADRSGDATMLVEQTLLAATRGGITDRTLRGTLRSLHTLHTDDPRFVAIGALLRTRATQHRHLDDVLCARRLIVATEQQEGQQQPQPGATKDV
jgi:hypothetical protein